MYLNLLFFMLLLATSAIVVMFNTNINTQESKQVMLLSHQSSDVDFSKISKTVLWHKYYFLNITDQKGYYNH